MMKLYSHRDHRGSRSALFDNMDTLEAGGLRASSSYSSGLDDHNNEQTMDSLHDRLTGDIHEEVETHNRMLDRMVFEKKSNKRICKLAGYFVISFFVLYYGISILLGFSCITCMVNIGLKCGTHALVHSFRDETPDEEYAISICIIAEARKSCLGTGIWKF
ncbi:hypothetical protein SASPL_147355 [Salvia splendens]|uniref:Blocked early in transport 1 n=1 Tax=Salvia splendens TaxID=180675 RepID=A0A8X8WF28_SALSN|nr:hypothetical protein SASPL_147355 [Salvia splendens]